MGLISKDKTWADEENVTYTDLNATFDTLYNCVNGNIDNDNVKASAGIAASKLDSTVITTTNSKTLTNKTLTKPKLVQPYTDIVTATDGATVTFDLSTGHIQQVTLGANRILAISNEQAGSAFALKIIQDGTGSRTVNWFSTINWVNGTAPTLTTTLNKADWFGFICTAADTYDGFIIGQNLSI
jgi:hypothetical protein